MLSRRSLVSTAVAAAATVPLKAHAVTLDPLFLPQTVSIRADLEPGQILILQKAHFLYFIEVPGQARRYGVGLGQAGQEISDRYVIGAKKEWPTWRPTDAMIERDPEAYGRFEDNDYVQPGGRDNPLGARALYLYRDGRYTFNAIHGTINPASIGRSVSNGCVRMINAHVIDLYARVQPGAQVTVM